MGEKTQKKHVFKILQTKPIMQHYTILPKPKGIRQNLVHALKSIKVGS